LNNGTKIPQIGLGTFLSTEGDIETVLKSAIVDHGYRHIDTASLYGNEEAIGRVLT
jgi:diketogulonate reductase-like aldo/keto reductase